MHVWARCSVHRALRGPGWHTACIHGVAHSVHTGWHMACTWNGTQRALEIAHGEHHEVAQGAHMGWYTACTRDRTRSTYIGWHMACTQGGTRRAHGTHTEWHTACPRDRTHTRWHKAHTWGGTRRTPRAAHRLRVRRQRQGCLEEPPPWRTAKARLSPAPGPP